MVKSFALITTNDPPQFIRWMDAPTNCKLGYAIVPRIIEDRPENLNPETEVLTRTKIVTIDSVTEGWAITQLPVEEIKRNAYQATIDAGYTVPGLGITLAMQESDRNAFTGLLSLLNEAISMGLKTITDPVAIADITGASYTVTIGQFKQIMLGYGLYISELWASSK